MLEHVVTQSTKMTGIFHVRNLEKFGENHRGKSMPKWGKI
jgi:hypothetical protein